MEIPTAEQQRQIKVEADEIKKAITQKRDSAVMITSSNVQRLFIDTLTSIVFYFVIAGLLLFVKLLQQNLVDVKLVVVGFTITLLVLFIFGISIVKLRQKQEEGKIKEKLIFPLLLASFIPYAFGLYLISINIYYVLTKFSISYLPQAIIYALLGFLVMKKVRMLQELGIRVSGRK